MFNLENSQIFLDTSFTDVFNAEQFDFLPLPPLQTSFSSNSAIWDSPPQFTCPLNISQIPKQLDPVATYNIVPLPPSYDAKKIIYNTKTQQFMTEAAQIYTFCPDQDHILTLLIQSYSKPNWPEIAQILQKQCPFGSKWTAQQCYQHWNRVCRPDLVKGRWSKDEDRQLYVILTQFKCLQFAEVCKRMPGRSDNQIRFRIKKLWPQWWDM